MSDQDFHKAWLLHQRPFKERSVIARFLVEGNGIVAMVVHGVRQSRSRLAASLQPFHRVLVRWRGRGELKTLVDLELDQHTFLASISSVTAISRFMRVCSTSRIRRTS